MKNKVNSFFSRKDLRVLSKKETRKIKGGNGTTSSDSNQKDSSDFVIEELIQI